MATVLYRLGRFAYRSRRLVALVWLAVAVLVGTAAAMLSGPASSSFSIPGTESQQALDLLEERFPELSAGGASARVVFAAPDGEKVTDPENVAVIREVLDRISAGPQVHSVLDPVAAGSLQAGLVSPDGRIALAEVTYAVDVVLLSGDARQTLVDAVESGRRAGLTVEAGGTATEQVPRIGAELTGVAVAVLVLVLTFGSLVAAGLPLLTGVTAVGVAVAAITALMGFVDLSEITPMLAVMIGLAVGIDYALFILSRYRHELTAGHPGEEAAGRAIGTAGTAVVFAGLTVVIALVGLAVNGISMLTQMGLAAAFAVVVAMLVALTLLPALLGFLGARINAARIPGPRARESSSLSRRWVGLVTRRPVITLVTVAVALGALAVPALQVRLGFVDEGSWDTGTTQRRAYDLIAEGFGPGYSGHLLVVADATASPDPATAIDQVGAALGGTAGIQAVLPARLDGAASTALFVVIPAEGPGSAATERLVHDIRGAVAGTAAGAGAGVAVTGSTALQIDVTERSRAAVLPYLLVLVGLSLTLLLLVFRSLLVPLKATLGFLLTVGAAFGALVCAFQWGWLESTLGIHPTGAINSLLPLVIVGIAFGLAMDYEFFLVTRIREAYTAGAGARAAVVTGFTHAARVVAAAATIMIAVFGAFGLFNDAIEVAQIGMALAVAVAVDAFLVRMTVVPAVLALVGDRAWWLPRWLDRLLPDVDVEGHTLAARLRDAAPGQRLPAPEPRTPRTTMTG
ncbi:MMPL family transporter [Phytohabitans suffuscus]|uniref:Membrane protein n=1 Tax=Phytohabitans suffuscus TaxID=624315 RepID=A0A6F8YQ20_9ACTN|nr:MMPL family transporter [Phytohabitans suffuscus]BCB88146.1 membrane protein [Phytohabitans suffuscus]